MQAAQGVNYKESNKFRGSASDKVIVKEEISCETEKEALDLTSTGLETTAVRRYEIVSVWPFCICFL